MKNPEILIIEGDETLPQDLKERLLCHGLEIIEAPDQIGVLRFFQSREPDLVILGSSRKSVANGLRVAEQIRQRDRNVPLILITKHSSEARAIAALRAGINDYFKVPFSYEELVASVSRHLPDGEGLREVHTDKPMIGDSMIMQEIKAYLSKVAVTDTTVLITGETGTGKELAAEMIHRNSPRHKRSFVCINCAALPESLLESELFGYERGAFTGAYSAYVGKLGLADGGTLFFDEIAEMTSYAQAKILRIIEGKKFYRVGGKRSTTLDFRVIAATNQDPERLVEEGKFRKDLYYRLNVARIHLPPLRERKQDIPPLLEHSIRELNRRFGRAVEGFTEKALALLIHYDWPGNIRELKNILEATFINLPSRQITFMDLPQPFQTQLREAEGLPKSERDRVLSALFVTHWNKTKAAQKLHWSRMTLYRKMTKYHIVTRPQP